MPRLATLALIFLAACKRESAAAASEPGTQADPLAACVDAQLSAKGLNQFGDPPETAYAGGTPLFDEKSGKSRDRLEFVLAHRPDVAAACAHDH
jgi:hypothetical protein